MSIVAKCENGHVLKVKNEFAGKSGLCPHCRGRVFVPMPVHADEKARVSDDEILGFLGPPSELKPDPPLPPPPSHAPMESIHDGPTGDSGINLMGSSILKNQKICPRCGNLTSTAFTNCPKCGTPLPNPGDAKEK